jgi:hypothetical protein
MEGLEPFDLRLTAPDRIVPHLGVVPEDDSPPTLSPRRLVRTLDSEVVGRRYYPCSIAAGEALRLCREPENPHDRNAIRVETLAGVKAGYLPRTCACWLAEWLDGGAIDPAVIVPEHSPEDARWGLPVRIDLWKEENVMLIGFARAPGTVRRLRTVPSFVVSPRRAAVIPFDRHPVHRT